MKRITNILTVDVEDWFQVANLEPYISRDQWKHCEWRLPQSLEHVLTLLRKHGIRATFFVLGWCADRDPDIVKRICDEGHEIGSHSYWHRLVYDMTPEEFEEDLQMSIEAVQRAVPSVRVRSYRAPSFSITQRSLWALEILRRNGIEFDSSIFPIRHHRYGVPSAPRFAYPIDTSAGTIWEIPVSTLRIFNRNVPFAGGAYFRLLPLWFVQYGIRSVNREGQPVVFYIHPWELDEGQPKVARGFFNRIRCYGGVPESLNKLETLFRSGANFGKTVGEPVPDVRQGLEVGSVQ
ncbi:MAG: DUF3473 domain-containing protein [Candidatus Caldarchaeum sp.]